MLEFHLPNYTPLLRSRWRSDNEIDRRNQNQRDKQAILTVCIWRIEIRTRGGFVQSLSCSLLTNLFQLTTTPQNHSPEETRHSNKTPRGSYRSSTQGCVMRVHGRRRSRPIFRCDSSKKKTPSRVRPPSNQNRAKIIIIMMMIIISFIKIYLTITQNLHIFMRLFGWYFRALMVYFIS